MKRTDFIIIHSIVACFILLAISPKLSSQEISWELSNGPKNSQGTFLPIYALGSTQNGYVFAGTNGLGVFKSTDMGENWENCSSPLFDYATISYLVVDTEDNVFVATNVGLYKTSDYGQNWIELLTGSSINSFIPVALSTIEKVSASANVTSLRLVFTAAIRTPYSPTGVSNRSMRTLLFVKVLSPALLSPYVPLSKSQG